MTLTILEAGPAITVQDMGRTGWRAQGLSRGGAVDRLALLEGAALLGADPANAVLEMTGFGGRFAVSTDTRIALTGAVMDADIDGQPVPHNCSHLLHAGQVLRIGGARSGSFGYISFAGGITTPLVMNARATQLTAGIGRLLASGDTLPLGPDPDPHAAPMYLPADDRRAGGDIRIIAGPQTEYFEPEILDAFATSSFQRSSRGNRQGVRMDTDGPGFTSKGQLTILSDMIAPGDIQMTGDGVPYVLLAEGQTTGGYPRIGTVIPADMPKVGQASPGAPIRFRFIDLDEADATYVSEAAQFRALQQACQPLLRDPHDIPDLLSYQLISGATPGDDLERP